MVSDWYIARYHHTHTQSARPKLIIGDNCYLKHAVFCFWGINNKIEIGAGTKVNAHKNGRETRFWCGADTEIIVSEDGLFSNSIMVSTIDFHRVYDIKGKLINKGKSITIGKHAWIGQRAYICKGVDLGDDVVVGACSVVTKPYTMGNVVIAGNPASIRKY